MANQIIHAKNINYQYNNDDLILKNVSFDVFNNEWLTIIGPNGSGKSTLVNIIDGLFNLQTGSIVVDNLQLNNNNLDSIRNKIGIVFQNPTNQFVGTTVEDDIAFGLENLNIPQAEMTGRIDNALDEVDMSSFKHSSINELSGGQQQRIAIAGIMAMRPKIIILDESTSMLDPIGRKNILKVVNDLKDKFNLTIISITHDIDEIKYSNRIMVMKNGEILNEDTPEKILSNENQLLNIGLDVPFVSKLKRKLKEHGIDVPAGYINERELLKWIMQLL